MPCLLCNYLQGVGPLLTEDDARQLPKLPSRDFKHDNIPWPKFLHSAEKCYCCAILQKGIVKCLQQRQLRPEQVVRINFRFLYPGWIDSDRGDDKDIICELDDGTEFVVEYFTLEGEDYPCPGAWEYVPVSTRTSPETSSEEAFSKACGWIENCDESHVSEIPEGEDPSQFSNYCLPSQQRLLSLEKLPTRVVDVGRLDGKVRLVEGNERAEKYLCLSHCWGEHQIITTTNSTLLERMHEIRTEDLSKTFSDAIQMTRRFEIDYIWIDSLCIIQDDAADWERESAQMASIYHNAYLTLAATKSRNGNGGLFTITPDFKISGTTPDGEEYYLIFREKIDHDLSMDNTSPQFPLMTRAWIFQERMLSPRVLHFGYYELFFECSTNAYCECDNIGFLSATDDIPLPNPRSLYSSALETTISTSNGKMSNNAWIRLTQYFIARVWRSFVMLYTGLHLTIPGDCLPALAGVARTFAEKRKSPYLSGLFQDSLLDDLLWMTFNCEKSRPQKWRAPSWSWASIEGLIEYQDGLITYQDDQVFLEKQEERIEFAFIEDCTSTPAGLNEFGQVSSGSLRVTSQLLPAALLLKADLDTLRRPQYYLCIENDGKILSPRVWPDYDLTRPGLYEVLSGAEVYCLRMTQQTKPKIDNSLILRFISTDTGKTFERIGSLQLNARTAQIDCLEPEMRELAIMALDKAEVTTVNIV
ncbi:HET-domain-containing protein [Hypoxylon trugodes]|uniref:HET-domain-containing protein n=1 Tax=Hypoxylon trugodes TaxID=326681 RepID=UPI002191CE81|nr:HET-domain-containing protein [Hypoxylon trugodes]KAI1385210.1 HET-domain-containing protein [Hypoxylon trugodes]